MKEKKVIIIYTTVPNYKEAKKISQKLIKKKLSGCINLFPLNSFYYWQGKIKNGKEYALIIKVLDKNCKKIKEEIKKNHPYLLPCILEISSKSNQEFFNWLLKVTI